MILAIFIPRRPIPGKAAQTYYHVYHLIIRGRFIRTFLVRPAYLDNIIVRAKLFIYTLFEERQFYGQFKARERLQSRLLSVFV